MNDILGELYTGKLDPIETINVKTEKYLSLQNEVAQIRDKLKDALSDDEKLLLDKLMEKTNEDGFWYGRACFVDGYRYGAKMLIEVYNTENDK